MRLSPSEPGAAAELEVRFGAGDLLPVLSWSIASDTMWWSNSMYRLHGYEPHDIEPSFALLVDHQHPADRERGERAFERIKRDARPFVFEHRLRTEAGQQRTVILDVAATVGANGRPALITGIYLDVSDARRIHHAAAEETVSGLQAEINRLNAQLDAQKMISEATGVLMERHKLPAGAASEVLRKASQTAGRKLHEVASELLFSGQLPAGVTPAVPTSKPRPGLHSPSRR